MPNNAPISSVLLRFPWKLGIDGQDNVYVLESTRYVLKLTQSGVADTIVGQVRGGSAGDGGPATKAFMNSLEGIAVDSAGNVYLADFQAHRVRKIAVDGIVSTVAGTGEQGFSGDGGPAVLARLAYPQAVGVDHLGNVYITDYGNNRVRRVSANGTISTIAGDGTSGYSDGGGRASAAQITPPRKIVADQQGNVFIVEPGNHIVRKITAQGAISVVAGIPRRSSGDDGPLATQSSLFLPQGIALDGRGGIYIADYGNARIRYVAPDGVVSTVAGGTGVGGPGNNFGDGTLALNAYLPNPYDVAIDSRGNLYIADLATKIRKVSTSGMITTFAGSGFINVEDTRDPLNSTFSLMLSAAMDRSGGLFFSDADGLWRLNPQGVVARVQFPLIEIAPGLGQQRRVEATALAIGPNGQPSWCTGGLHRCERRDPNGNVVAIAGNGTAGFSGDGGPATQAQLNYPSAMVYDSVGNLYIVDSFNQRVRRVAVNGTITTFAGTGSFVDNGDQPRLSVNLYFPNSLAVDQSDTLYVADRTRVRAVPLTGNTRTIAGSGEELFSLPGLSARTAVAATATPISPSGIAFDSRGVLYIGDGRRNQILTVSPDGGMSLFAGNGVGGDSGDDLPASEARLDLPQSLAFSPDQRWLYFLDRNNLRIRKVELIAPLSRNSVDVDGQGKSAIVARSDFGSMLIGRFNGREFEFLSSPDPGPGNQVLGIADFGRTGKSDLAYINPGQGTVRDVNIWPSFDSSKRSVLRTVRQGWEVQAVADMDGDGFSDIVWRYVADDPRDTGVSYIWFNRNGRVDQVRKRGGAPLTWKIVGAADITDDGAADLFYLAPSGQLRALVATRNRTCANLDLGNLPPGYTVEKIADFLGSRQPELLLRHIGSGDTQLLSFDTSRITVPEPTASPDDPNASCSPFASQTQPVPRSSRSVGAVDPSWRLYASGDFNGDGSVDIAWSRPDGQLVLWLMSKDKSTGPTVIGNAGRAPNGFRVVQP